MPSETDLRELFGSSDAPNRLDAGRVIARSRARRLPKQLAAGVLGALAVAGIGVAVLQLPQPIPISSADGTSLSEGAQSPRDSGPLGSNPTEALADGDIRMAPAEKINFCEAPLAELSPGTSGLRLDIEFPDTAAPTAGAIEGIVRLTNTSDVQVIGYTAATPAVTLSQDGMVLWHSNGPMIQSAVEVDLAPGASIEYRASFLPVRCGIEDDSSESFRTDLPVVPAGVYDLSAIIYFNAAVPADVTEAGGSSVSGIDVVTGPLSPITLG